MPHITNQEIIELWKKTQDAKVVKEIPENIHIIDLPKQMAYHLYVDIETEPLPEEDKKFLSEEDQKFLKEYFTKDSDNKVLHKPLGLVRVANIKDPNLQKKAHKRLLEKIPPAKNFKSRTLAGA